MSKTVLTLRQRHQSKSLLAKNRHLILLKNRRAIENIIKDKGYFESKTELYHMLNFPTVIINAVFRDLKYSNKLQVNKDGSFVWIYSDKNDRLAKTIKKSVLLR